MNAPSPIDRAAADRPTPRPGILDITPYVPGKSKAEGITEPVKLSSNENILGCSPAAKAAFIAAAERLNLYPDGRSDALRQAVAAHFALEPERLVFGDGTDELLHMICQVYLEPGDNIVQGRYGFGAYAIGARACGAEARLAPEPNLKLDVD
ncbi:MAG: aminotransferase class I/II-fold pyridoxal phosphate-dependent enzyme, partial [Caulobacteraceae bacterium]|nr:aminotransferase class I/II-fold pyridoxal phosphate-dependent enzyme [Caulobacteraceae bacterium]